MASALAPRIAAPLAPGEIAPTAAAHRETISAWVRPEGYNRAILPSDVATEIRYQVEQLTQGTCRPDWAFAMAVQFNGAWPQAMPDADATKIYLRHVASILGEFPAPIAAAAATRLIRSVKFRPAISEILEACEAERGAWRTLLIGLDRMEGARTAAAHEHDWRRRRDEEDRVADEKAVRLFGAVGVVSGDYMAAWRAYGAIETPKGKPSAFFRWLRLFKQDEEWGAELAIPMRQAAIVGRAIEAGGSAVELGQIASLLDLDRDAEARTIVDSIVERGEPKPAPSAERAGAVKTLQAMLISALPVSQDAHPSPEKTAARPAGGSTQPA